MTEVHSHVRKQYQRKIRRLRRQRVQGSIISGSLIIGSEVKSIEQLCEKIDYFPPGCCATIPIAGGRSGRFIKIAIFEEKRIFRCIPIQQYYYIPAVADRFLSMDNTKELVRVTLKSSVEKRLMGNRQFGFMLSGGLDSSLIAAIATKYLQHVRTLFNAKLIRHAFRSQLLFPLDSKIRQTWTMLDWSPNSSTFHTKF